MKRLALLAVLAGCDLFPAGDPLRFSSASPEGNPTQGRIAFAPDGKVYNSTYGGLYVYNDGFELIRDSIGGAFLGMLFIDRSHAIYWSGFRSTPTGTGWEPAGLPPGRDYDFAESSTGDVYVTMGVEENTTFASQLYRRSGSGPGWVAVGPPTAQVYRLFSDAKGGVWFEAGTGELYVARGDTLSYVRRSQGLQAIGPDGTAYYRIDGQYGGILAIDDSGERVVTRGACEPTDTIDCPISFSTTTGEGFFSNFQLGRDGAFYETFAIDPNGGEVKAVLRLRLGETAWRPIAEAFEPYIASEGGFGLFVAEDSTMWTSANEQIGGISGDGYYNALFGYVFKAKAD